MRKTILWPESGYRPLSQGQSLELETMLTARSFVRKKQTEDKHSGKAFQGRHRVYWELWPKKMLGLYGQNRKGLRQLTGFLTGYCKLRKYLTVLALEINGGFRFCEETPDYILTTWQWYKTGSMPERLLCAHGALLSLEPFQTHFRPKWSAVAETILNTTWRDGDRSSIDLLRRKCKFYYGKSRQRDLEYFNSTIKSSLLSRLI